MTAATPRSTRSTPRSSTRPLPTRSDATTDGWATTDDTVTSPTVVSQNFTPPLLLAQPSGTLAGNVLYWGAEQPYKSTDGGQTWSVLAAAHTAADNQSNISALTAAPSNHSVIYAGWGDGTVQVSQNGGTTWNTITPPTETAGTDTWITHIAVDPTNPNHVAVTFSGFSFPQSSPTAQPHVLVTSNALSAGPGWVDVTGTGLPGAPTNAAVWDGGLLLVGNDVGVYSAVPNTSNGPGTVWSPLGSSLPFVPVMDLSLSSDGSTLVAATHGRGAWKLTLPSTGHELLIDELRLAGPSGTGAGNSGDGYVDIFNSSPKAVSLNGWSLVYQSGASSTTLALPTTASIPAGGHYLVAESQYSLAGAAAADDAPAGLTIPSGGGVRLVGPAPGSVVSDTVGFTTAQAAFREGTGLTAPATPSSQHAFVRKHSNGRPVDTDNNAADFSLVAVGGPTGSAGAIFGAPDPLDLASPFQRDGGLPSTLLDPTVAAGLAPNRVYNSVSHTLTVRRTITNNTGRTVERAAAAVHFDHDRRSTGHPRQPAGAELDHVDGHDCGRAGHGGGADAAPAT